MEKTKVIWEPLKGSQTLSLSCPANEILYDGTRGPGKTDAQLMRFRSRVGLGYGAFWRGVIFDREYKNLDDLVSKSRRWFPQFNDGARWLSSTKDYKWVWPTGEELLFRTLQKIEDYWDYHGQEYAFIGFNELTKYPTSELYDLIISCNRSSFIPELNPVISEGSIIHLPEIPLEMFSTCNPHGAGHNWVKKKFIDPAPPGKIISEVTVVYNPRTEKYEDVVRTRVRIFGSWRENKFLSPVYIAALSQIKDPNKKRAWNNGDWNVTAGGMFDDLWDSDQHVIEDFQIPHSWYIDRAYDHGSSKPFSVGWYAISDGSELVLNDGRILHTVRGDVFRIGEWYGCTETPNKGLNLLPSKIAEGIIEREIKMGIYGRVNPGPADGSIYDSSDGNSIAFEMSKGVNINGVKYPGVQWTKADKSPGSRKIGWEKVRIILFGSLTSFLEDNKVVHKKREHPGLFIFRSCLKTIELLPITPRDPKDMDDVDTDSEDHLQDEVRYKALSLSYISGNRTVGLGG